MTYKRLAKLRSLLIKRLDPHMQEVMRGAGVAFLLRVTGAGFGFMFNVLLARLLGAEGAGTYFLAFTVTAIATVVGRIGLDHVLLRFTAAHATMGNWSAVKGLYRQGIGLALLMASFTAAVVVISAPLIARGIFSEAALVTPLRWMALSIVPMSLLTLYGELLKGLKKTRDAMFVQSAGLSMLSFLLLLLARSDWGVLGAVFAYTFASVLTLLVGVYLWHRAVPQLRTAEGEFSRRLLISTGLPLLLVAVMDQAMSLTGTIVLGIFGKTADVGVYGVAMRTALLTSFILIAVNSIVAPKFAALYRQGDMRTLEAVAQNSTKLMTLLAAPMLLLFILSPGWILQIFGKGFEAGAAALAILAIGQFVNVAMGSVGFLLVMSGHERLWRNNVAGAAALNIILNVLLVPRYGPNGAAIATAVGVAAMNIGAALLVYRRLGVVSIGIRWC